MELKALLQNVKLADNTTNKANQFYNIVKDARSLTFTNFVHCFYCRQKYFLLCHHAALSNRGPPVPNLRNLFLLFNLLCISRFFGYSTEALRNIYI